VSKALRTPARISLTAFRPTTSALILCPSGDSCTSSAFPTGFRGSCSNLTFPPVANQCCSALRVVALWFALQPADWLGLECASPWERNPRMAPRALRKSAPN
jgi:hypothetical protein